MSEIFNAWVMYGFDAAKPNSITVTKALVTVMEFGLAASKPYITQALKISDKEMKVFMKLFIEGRSLGLNRLKKK